MSYPKNDHHFQTFVIGRVEDHDDHWKIFAQTGSYAVICRKSGNRIIPRAGWCCRVYTADNTERGCYIAGRKIFYRNAEQHRNLVRLNFATHGLRPIANPSKRARIGTYT